MKMLKPNFWYKKNNLISLFLLPISYIYQVLFFLKKKLTSELSFKIPIICLGNIHVGGTGKTPLSILIAKELILKKKKPAIIKKYYPDHSDEHNLINEKLNCLFLNKQRSKALDAAIKNQYDFAILDDGFQDYSIKKNLNILCFNSEQLIGNGMVLPSGPLRESLSSIKKAQIIIINGNKNQLFENKIKSISKKVEVLYSKYVPTNIEKFKNKNLFAFAGIGNPSNFFKLLTDNNLKVKKKIEFPDHYEFNKNQVQEMINLANKEKLELITTEKDYFRIKKFHLKNINFLTIRLEIDKKSELINYILNLR